MSSIQVRKALILLGVSILFFLIGAAAFAADPPAAAAAAATPVATGIGKVAQNVQTNFSAIAKLITAGSYIAGLGFGVGAIVKFKAHKDAPTQTPLSQPIALLFVAAALMFIPSVFQTAGRTLYGTSGDVAGISGTAVIEP